MLRPICAQATCGTSRRLLSRRPPSAVLQQVASRSADYILNGPAGEGSLLPPADPVNLAVSKIGPALMAGNSVVIKPPTQGAVSALQMVQVGPCIPDRRLRST